MSDQPLTSGGLRGAVDLTALRNQPPSGGQPAGPAGGSAPAAPGAAAGPSSGGVPGRSGVVVEGSDATFQEIANASVGVPMLLVLWAAQIPESRDYLDTVVEVARSYGGRFQVVSIDVEKNPALLQAFQVQTVPVTIGLLQGQPVPLFAGVQPAEQLRPVLDQLLQLAVQQGVTGRVTLDADQAPSDDDPVIVWPATTAALLSLSRKSATSNDRDERETSPAANGEPQVSSNSACQI